MRTPRQLSLQVNKEWLVGGQAVEQAHDVFIINERTLMMPQAIIPGDLTLDAAHAKLPGLKAGAVAMGYGTFWCFWETDACLGPTEDEKTSGEDSYKAALAAGTIIDMHGGCYLLQDNGEWDLLGAS